MYFTAKHSYCLLFSGFCTQKYFTQIRKNCIWCLFFSSFFGVWRGGGGGGGGRDEGVVHILVFRSKHNVWFQMLSTGFWANKCFLAKHNKCFIIISRFCTHNYFKTARPVSDSESCVLCCFCCSQNYMVCGTVTWWDFVAVVLVCCF